MLTVTDNHGADKREEDLLYDHADVASTTHLFPEVRDGTATRPPRYPEKAEVIISARVHPGETPASFVLDGLLELLLRPDDRRRRYCDGIMCSGSSRKSTPTASIVAL